MTDHNRRIVKVNDSFVRIYGWSRSDLIGADFINIIAADERDLARRNHEEFIRGGIRKFGEMKLVRKNNSNANVLFTTANALELSVKTPLSGDDDHGYHASQADGAILARGERTGGRCEPGENRRFSPTCRTSFARR